MPPRDDAIVVKCELCNILRCSDATLYIGETRNIDLQLIRHNEGSATPSTSIVHVRMPSAAILYGPSRVPEVRGHRSPA